MIEAENLIDNQDKEMPSLNHSYICVQIMRQLLQNEELLPLPELTLDIENGLTPDISVFKKNQIQPNFLDDVLKFERPPIVAIEIISSSQSIQSILNKSKVLVDAGIKAVWVIEPYGRSIFVVTATGGKVFHEEAVESEGIKVDFSQVFRI